MIHGQAASAGSGLASGHQAGMWGLRVSLEGAGPSEGSGALRISDSDRRLPGHHGAVPGPRGFCEVKLEIPPQ